MKWLKSMTFFLLLLLSSVSCRNNVKYLSVTADSSLSSRFQIMDFGIYRKLIIKNPWQESVNKTFNYYLFRENVSIPDSIPSDQIIRIPLRRIICMSTTHIAMINELGASDAIIGISGKDLVYNKNIREKIESGLIPDVGYESNLNKELIVSLKPDLLMTYGVNPSSVGYLSKLEELGIKVMFNADYLESNPLARAEWIKVFGVLLDKEKMADSIFTSVSENYNKICDSLSSVTSPGKKVLLGVPWNDVWYVSPGNTYAAQLIKDAGGEYLYSDFIAPNSRPFSVESVFIKAMEADVWLTCGAARSLDELFDSDYRLRNLPVSSSGYVFNNDNRLNSSGGNDYWESAAIRPDIVLNDIAAILHPDIFPNYKMKYYRKLN